jgi:Tol biopolymer transport system component
MYWVPVDGSSQAELLLATETAANPSSWTPDGKALLFTQTDGDLKNHIWVLPAPGTGSDNKPHEFLHTAFNEGAAQISPDGKWVAYQSNESGQTHVYVRPFPGPGGKVQVSTQPGAATPRWSRSGRELFYRDTVSGQFWLVDVPPGAVFHAGQPQDLFKQTGTFDVSPDGKRFLLVKVPQAAPGGSKLEAVVDWFEELRRRAPVKK